MKKSTVAIFILFCILHLTLTAQNFSDPMLSERLQDHVKILASDSMEGRGLGTEGKIRAKNYIASQFEAAGLQPISKDYFQHIKVRIGLAWVDATNIVGYLPGADPKLQHEVIVIGAHYDHLGYKLTDNRRTVFPGADDNASGTAVMIELARLFAKNEGDRRRTIVFIAFDAEESGLLGASAFLNENTRFSPENIRLMFSLDMVGMHSANRGIEMKGVGSLAGGVDIARAVASKHNIRLLDLSASIESATDTRPFGQRGIPAVHVFTGMNSPYHKPQDTWNLLDYEGMARITAYMFELVQEFSVMPHLQFNRTGDFSLRPAYLKFNSGVLAYTGGTHHDYANRYFKAKAVFAFSGGVFLQTHMGRRISLQPELLYSFNGSRAEGGIFRRHSLTVPFNLQLNLMNEAGGLYRFYPFAGPYFSYSFAGSLGKDALDFENDYQDQETGLQFGFGFDINKVQLRFTSTHAFDPIFRDSKSKVLSKGNYLTIGYKF